MYPVDDFENYIYIYKGDGENVENQKDEYGEDTREGKQ